MDMTRLITQLASLFLKKFLRRAITQGLDAAIKPNNPTPESRAQEQSARNLAQRATQIARLTRRLF